jgi:hypothetical protein
MSFAIGQRARCVNAVGWSCVGGPWLPGPDFGDVVVVVEIDQAPHPTTGERTDWIGLAGFIAPGATLPSLYDASNFRPIEDREIERLRAIAAAPGGARAHEGIVA